MATLRVMAFAAFCVLMLLALALLVLVDYMVSWIHQKFAPKLGAHSNKEKR
jgi:hypothetical protein